MNNPFQFAGRIRRTHFLIVWIVLNGLSGITSRAAEEPGASPFLYLILLGIFWPFVTLMVQRAHDSGRNGLFVLRALSLLIAGAVVALIGASLGAENGSVLGTSVAVPGAIAALGGLVMTLVVAFAPGQSDENEYGPNPRPNTRHNSDSEPVPEEDDNLVDLRAQRGYGDAPE